MCKRMLVTMVVLGCLAGAVSAAMISEDFSTLPSIAVSKTGFTWAGIGLNESLFVSSPSSLRLATSGGSGISYGYFTWDLGTDYDCYAGGAGDCTVQVSRNSTASWVRVELLDDGDSKASVQYSFTDYETFHQLAVPMDGDETGIDAVRFTILRYSGTGGAKIDVDDFSVTPEPATMLMLLSGGLMAIRKRSRS